MSSDELGDFDTQSPQVAGPSTSNIKRKHKPDSKKAAHIITTKKPAQRVEEPTEVSSDNEPPPRQKARRGKGPTMNTVVNGHVNGRAAPLSKSKGRIERPPPDSSNSTKDQKDIPESRFVGTVNDDEDIAEENIPLSKTDKGKTIPPANLQRRYDDAIKQRDDFANQLEQLVHLRHTESEKLLQEQKKQYEARLQAQQEIILEQQTLLDQQYDAEVSGDVQREVNKLKASLREKETALSAKDKEISELSDHLKTANSDLAVEIENSKRLAARDRTGPNSSSKNFGKLDSRNALILRLYEELTGILITNVKHDPGAFKDEDAIFACVQTARNNTASLHFTLKYTTVSDMDAVSEKVIYTPNNLEKESPSFIEQLDFLAKPFTFEREQMQVFFQTLTSHLENNPGDDGEVSRMEE